MPRSLALRLLVMQIAAVALTLPACTGYTTAALKPLAEPLAGEVALALRLSVVVVEKNLPPPFVDETPATCIGRRAAVEALTQAATEVESATGPIAALPAYRLDYGSCVEGMALAEIRDSRLATGVRKTIASAVSLTELGLALGRVQARDCVGYEIGTAAMRWIAVDIADEILADLASETADRVIDVERQPMRYDLCLPTSPATP